ncbi:ABC-2 type transport system ATP-binding protein [Amycolatopsis pretoriensis]|uniref:ABC-2 type transport system ATP-binding protein n=1 Tax=Amycolatopsis pretoriensis TaxID=218821 RepID=A0A1H5QN52_9PSEU|nr:ATP-binding cassette domain-containing protein [Amycolatopsis pretoriensis]SEF27496.1 ABC-2 type transport system ATP-binding protein [Amycolatopsis pretoriensis]
MITARGLERRFRRKGRSGGEVHAVKGVDLDVEAGELVGFLGPNGAGKTTTLRMLTTLLKPSAGTATVGGRDLLSDPLGVRERIGYVAQGGGSSPETTVADELELQGRLYRMSKADAIARGAELAEQLDLTGLDQRLTRTLSGGQRRRLDIALGLIHSPGLVFLDEPSTGLDPQSRANLWDHIRRLRAEQGVTVFLTTHYLDEADALSDRLIVIDDGRIVAEGTPDALKARVNGDRVEVGVDPEQGADAAEIASRLAGAHELSADGGVVRFRVPRGDVALPELLRALDAKSIPMLSVQVHRPTLDDVFLTLTGRSLREAEEGTRAA